MKSARFVPAFLFLVSLIHAYADDATPLPTDNPQAVALYNSCLAGDTTEVRNLISGGAPVDGHIGKGLFTPLVGAIEKGHVDVVRCLLDAHAGVNVVDFQGSTPLLHACWLRNLDCAEMLLAAGADANLASHFGRTPLMYAAQYGDDRIVQDLIDQKAKLDANCNEGPAITWAAVADQLSTVQKLGDAGANVNLAPERGNPDHYSTLGCCSANNDLQMIDYLISKGADPNGVGGLGERTPIMAAVDYKRVEALEDLLGKGADIDRKNKEGRTALMVACHDAVWDSVKMLVDHHANLDLTDARGETALNIAGNSGQIEIVEMLKAAGAKNTEIHIMAKPDPVVPPSPAQAWALAVATIYTQRADFNPRVLGGEADPGDRRHMLQRDWKVKDKAGLLKELDDLRDKGHHALYQSEGKKLAAMDDITFAKFLLANPKAVFTINAMRSSYLKWKDRSGLAWDLCRSANLVNAGYAAKYLDEKEAWDRLLAIAQETQKNFSSWQEMSDNFLDGREIWAHHRDPHFDAVAQLLLNSGEPNSPWNQNAWSTNLSGN